MTRVHLVGIGGAGVSALAQVFLARGDQVSGCDLRESRTTGALAAAGARVVIGHDRSHAAGQDLLVYSGAVHSGADEIEAARAAGIRVLTRAEMLAELISATESVAIAGTHGKTTLTHMLGQVLTAAGFDPTVLVGDGSSARAGHGGWLVAEADESDGTLVLHRPRHAILTNVEHDHPDHFAGVAEVDALFRRFLAAVPETGLAVICADDERAAAMPAGGRRVKYGFTSSADYRCTDERPFRLFRGDRLLATIPLGVPGRHNVQNATGAAALAIELGAAPAVVARALAGFRGAARRLERLGSWRGAEIYDDYGHHPTEVRATLEAARELPHRRLVLVFQPHRYSRFQALAGGFANSLAGADRAIVSEIYPAGEANPGGVSAQSLAAAAGAGFAADLGQARRQLEDLVEAGDLVLLMGAGDIRRLGDELATDR